MEVGRLGRHRAGPALRLERCGAPVAGGETDQFGASI